MPDTDTNKKTCPWWHCCCGAGSVGWGIFFLALGAYFIAQDLGYVASDISLWSIAVVAFGLLLLLQGIQK